ncbi:hypothetical protein HPB51_009029 [Rhipicephalus microplus]|uniref:Uncharacterized protein n=1 Tax=Rhipicephalus microplus TaxID=6941 RepID=A0A9J6D9U6_RHIMP|nr:hypothetical protein HPB51_009029 [Rhipicephalus microplus]
MKWCGNPCGLLSSPVKCLLASRPPGQPFDASSCGSGRRPLRGEAAARPEAPPEGVRGPTGAGPGVGAGQRPAAAVADDLAAAFRSGRPVLVPCPIQVGAPLGVPRQAPRFTGSEKTPFPDPMRRFGEILRSGLLASSPFGRAPQPGSVLAAVPELTDSPGGTWSRPCRVSVPVRAARKSALCNRARLTGAGTPDPAVRHGRSRLV